MSKTARVIVIGVLYTILITGFAHAGVLGTVKSWLTGEVLALFISGFVALLGGIFGMGLGYLGAMGLSSLINSALPEASWDPVISVMSVIVAVVFSTLIGVVFGVYPAANAARQDPISALRYE